MLVYAQTTMQDAFEQLRVYAIQLCQLVDSVCIQSCGFRYITHHLASPVLDGSQVTLLAALVLFITFRML